ncbi:MAG TPA: peptide chain release factor N(5)-glutamine methyltransferase [Spirochaetes bacterium]|nr:peptide chain release factor N(5)-glutamine methyltransferase [Spirochaetota bacterium]
MVKKTLSLTLNRIIQEAKADLLLGDIYLLLEHAIGRGKEFIYTYPMYSPTENELDRWEECRTRRLKGEPVSYITGWREFYSLDFKVDRFTLIPRQETELLVDQVLLRRPDSLLDIGTGCGNIAVSVRYHLNRCLVTAVDLSVKAVQMARYNANRLLGQHDIRFIKSNYFNELDKVEFDVIVSNPPYIKSSDIDRLPIEISSYEPRIALDGGSDGLMTYSKIIGDSQPYLSQAGKLILELDPELLGGVMTIAEEKNYTVENVVKDLGLNDRVIVLSP